VPEGYADQVRLGAVLAEPGGVRPAEIVRRGAVELRVYADIYWNEETIRGNVARLYSEWHPVADVADSEIADVVSGIEQRRLRA
jgi:hypothetical protein